jgi:uncharacterized protein YndB with AHSA1/START domain
MSTVSREIPASVDRIWAVLADPMRYADWVVGAKRVRSVEGHWPEKGSKFHHTVGVWPLRLRDNTMAIESNPPQHLALEVRIRPVGRARVDLDLRTTGTGTLVSMTEVPASPALLRWARPVIDPLTHQRNVSALRRLAGVVAKMPQ